VLRDHGVSRGIPARLDLIRGKSGIDFAAAVRRFTARPCAIFRVVYG
jgi:hypothetical protein